jgi:hypothetical protein
MLLKSSKSGFNSDSLFINDLRDAENKYYFSFEGAEYFHILSELSDSPQITTNYKEYKILLPIGVCTCTYNKPTLLVINNLCVHLKYKIMSIYKSNLTNLSFLLLKDFIPETKFYQISDTLNNHVYLGIFPYKKHVIIYYQKQQKIYGKIKYYPFKKGFEFGAELNLEENIKKLVDKVKEKLSIINEVVVKQKPSAV